MLNAPEASANNVPQAAEFPLANFVVGAARRVERRIARNSTSQASLFEGGRASKEACFNDRILEISFVCR